MERCCTAQEALDTVTHLLGKHGQCGLTSEDHNFGQWSYNTTFLFVDTTEAWVLETAGDFWAAKRISGTYLVYTKVISLCFRKCIQFVQ